MADIFETIERIAHFYGNGNELQETPTRWVTHCNIHDDKTPSMVLEPNNSGRWPGFKVICRSQRCKGMVKRMVEDGVLQASGSGLIPKASRGRLITPVPNDAPERPLTCRIKTDDHHPTQLWAYLNEAGQALFYVARFMLHGKKTYRRLCLFEHKQKPGVLGWSWAQPENWNNIPLYGLERLGTDKPVLIVGGEKAADAAQRLFPTLAVVAYLGGETNFTKADWEPIKGRDVIIWPDCDDTGLKLTTKNDGLTTYLEKRGHKVRIVDIWKHRAELDTIKHGWDLADQTPQEWGPQVLQDLLWNSVERAVLTNETLLTFCNYIKTKDPRTNAEFVKLSKTSCRSTEEPECRYCIYRKRFDSPLTISQLNEIERDWIYLKVPKQFYNVRRKGEPLDKEGFNNAHAYLGYDLYGAESAAGVFLLNGTTTRVDALDNWPGMPVMIQDDQGNPRVNAWTPWMTRVARFQPTQWLTLLEHLFPEERARGHVLDYLAFTLQKPHLKINHGLLIISDQGVGKSGFTAPLERIMGSSFTNVDAAVVDTPYNRFLLGTKLLMIEEVFSIGHSKSLYNKLKTWTAAPPSTITINIKMGRMFNIRNLTSVIAFSNEERPIIMDETDRRWFVYKIENKPLSAKFYSEYFDWIGVDKEGPGVAMIQDYLMKRDLSGFQPGKIPDQTEAKTNLQSISDPVHAEIKDLMEEFMPPFNKDLWTLYELSTALQERGLKRSPRQLSGKLAKWNAFTMVGKADFRGEMTGDGQKNPMPRMWTHRTDKGVIQEYLALSPRALAERHMCKKSKGGTIIDISGKPRDLPF